MNELIKKSAIIIARKHNINVSDLNYIGYTDCSCFRNEGDVLFQFNVLKKDHEKYGSTVGLLSWDM